MNTYHLKFIDEGEAVAAMSSYRVNEQWWADSINHNLDVIGVMYRPTGAMLTDTSGDKYPEMAPIDGYHVNLLLNTTIPAELQTYVIAPPVTPSRVFA